MNPTAPTGTCPTCGKVLDQDAAFCPQCGTSRVGATPAPDSMIGRWIIGQYVVRQKLGEGGMGVVYLADQPSVGRQAVIKMLHPELLRDPSVAPRFEIEARAASQLNHPHIITIYNYGAMEDGTLYLAMEYCNGVSLEHALQQGAFSSERAVTVGARIADALAEAHRHGVVHRDLKPSNIMLEQVGRRSDFVKVLDFGIAKVEGLKMTKTGMMIGTPQYMSPEQLKGEGLDGRADIYSLGVMLYEMVAGKLPFESDTLAGFMHKHLNEIPRAPTAVSPQLNINRALESVILRCLEKDSTRRISDADELVSLLEACASPTAIPMPPLAPARTESSHVGLWLGVFGGILVAVAAAVVLVMIFWEPAVRPAHETTVAVADEETEGEATTSGEESGHKTGGSLGHGPDARVVEAVADAAPTVTSRRPPQKKKDPKKARKTGGKKKRTELAENRTSGTGKGDKQRSRDRQAAGPRTGPKKGKPVSSVFPGLREDPRAKALAAKSVTQLEKKLKKILKTARVPPSSLDKVLQGYAQSMATWPPARKETMRKQYLVSLISTYKRPALQFKRHERRPFAQLKKIYLGMETKNGMSVQQRERILANVLKAYDRPSFPKKDRAFYRRMAVLNLIKSHAADYKGVWK